MNPLLSLLLLIGLAATYVSITAFDLPPTVAAHFGAGGVPDGYMSRQGYMAFMLALVVALPLLVASSVRLVGWLPPKLVNLPNKDYWLAPERRERTHAWIRSRTAIYAHFLVLFLCFIHWLTLEAHAGSPVRLPEGPFFTGLAIFVAVTLLWAGAFHFRFRKRN